MKRAPTVRRLATEGSVPPRVVSVAAWDATPEGRTPVSWSELAPPVLPVQTIVTVTVSHGEGVAEGVAGLTRYLEPGRASRYNGADEESLASWMGVDAATFGTIRPRRPNPYDPIPDSVFVVVQLAIADALGRLSNLPASVFFGGACRAGVPAYASLPSFRDPDAAVDCALDACREGFTAVKFHGSGLVDADVETIAAARGRLGPEVTLLWDGSCSYDLPSALAVAEALTKYGFLWFEAPFADDRGSLLRRLAARSGLPLLPDGMALRSADDWLRDISDGIWGALRFDVTYAPTLAHARRLVRLAEVLGIHCEIQSFGFPLTQYPNLQLILSTPACRFFEAPFPPVDLTDGLVSAPTIVNGQVLAPSSPGLGHALSLDDVARGAQLVARVSLD